MSAYADKTKGLKTLKFAAIASFISLFFGKVYTFSASPKYLMFTLINLVKKLLNVDPFDYWPPF